MTLRISSPQLEGVYQGSKYLKYQVLCDAEELTVLFDRLGPFYIYHLTGLSDAEPIEREKFLGEYNRWIQGLKEGNIPSDQALRTILASAWTVDTKELWRQQVPGNKYIVKLGGPIVQVQSHFFTYSPIDGVFRPMTMGLGNIFWGLQFSFPQIYQNPKTMELLEVEDCPNAQLFQTIKQWVRDVTRATPFIVGGKKTNVPIRLGKGCFSWIHKHPQLIQQGIEVYAN